ncbi:alpha/beta hydrolase [uncultured Tissierella sp.]|uniref:alpha/beta hydrolase n=1 Tax=uncultured Tissierella sp. TaxID=448160 RepID=UPI002805C7D0|nr:alpha/beta hydrolase [uncultured Tissierella sp.]MDU5082868.1 alpha/beta hydrolase [Bacillota bacterium]
MYSSNNSWKELQPLLPDKNQIDINSTPFEKYVNIDSMEIHIDEYDNNSEITVIIFHGVGGNGRLLSFFAIPLVRAGYNVICPDLPGYGFSKYSKQVTYSDWINVGSKIIEIELSKSKKVFIIGLSAGGMLAYNVACKHQNISGLIVTNILDNREEKVRIYSAKNKFHAKYGIRFLNLLPSFLRTLKIPIRMVTNMNALVNDKEILNVLLKDKYGAGSSISINFLLSLMNSKPLIEPDNFKNVPVLMVHPGNDLWTPLEISEMFFNKITSNKRKVILDNAGHFPIEEPGLTQMENAIYNFIKELSSTQD